MKNNFKTICIYIPMTAPAINRPKENINKRKFIYPQATPLLL